MPRTKLSQPVPRDAYARTIDPKPRQTFDLGHESPASPTSTVTDLNAVNTRLDATGSTMSGATTPARTRSVLNLTSSTLFGIYQPSGYSADREDATPFGSGAQTPATDYRRGSFDFTPASRIPANIEVKPNGTLKRRRNTGALKQRPRKGFKGYVLPLVAKELALFGTGVLYGLLVSHLHDRQQIAPVQIDINRSSWIYLTIWGIAGVLFGEVLPWVDSLWADQADEDIEETEEERRQKYRRGWFDVVRSAGAFVGIAFAIRKLPWQSTSQLSLTLALANPALWYLIDRSPPGFILSMVVAIVGTTALLAIDPSLIPMASTETFLDVAGFNATESILPKNELVLGLLSHEFVSVWTWIASVLFVSAVCFGNIGRQLAPQRL